MPLPDDELQSRVLGLLRDCVVAMNGLGHRFADATGVHPTDLHALELLSRCAAEGEGLTIGELGARLELSSGAVTGVVDRLVRGGHVERVADPHDRRRVRLRMTASAHELASAYFGSYAARVCEAMADVPARDLRRIAGFLDAARAAADEVVAP